MAPPPRLLLSRGGARAVVLSLRVSPLPHKAPLGTLRASHYGWLFWAVGKPQLLGIEATMTFLSNTLLTPSSKRKMENNTPAPSPTPAFQGPLSLLCTCPVHSAHSVLLAHTHGNLLGNPESVGLRPEFNCQKGPRPRWRWLGCG